MYTSSHTFNRIKRFSRPRMASFMRGRRIAKAKATEKRIGMRF